MFKIGDYVESKGKNGVQKGRRGKIIDIFYHYGTELFAVDWGLGFSGHSLNKKIKTNTGYNVEGGTIRLCKKSNIGEY